MVTGARQTGKQRSVMEPGGVKAIGPDAQPQREAKRRYCDDREAGALSRRERAQRPERRSASNEHQRQRRNDNLRRQRARFESNRCCLSKRQSRERAAQPIASGLKASSSIRPPRAGLSWACLLKRVFAIDIERCPRCGGRLKIIAAILDPQVIVQFLTHLGLPARSPPRSAARPLPLLQAA